MSSFNQLIIMGHVTRDVQQRTLPSGKPVAEWGVATNHKWKSANGEEKEEVCFIDCTAFGRTGEAIAEYFEKGKPIFLVGRLSQDTWVDKQSGTKRSKHKMVVEGFKFLGGKADGEPRPAKPAANPISDEPRFNESDIPF